MILYFGKGNEKREIGRPENIAEALHIIYEFCEDKGFYIHYTRMWSKDGINTFDVGSHTEFFTLEDTNE